MLRNIYYLLSPSMRFLVRRVVYLPLDIVNSFKSNKNVVPPKGLVYTGGGDFFQQGVDWLDFFKKNQTIDEGSKVLDIGSGIGRIAIPLTGFLKEEYHGFDVVKKGVDWCDKNIAQKYPNFHFKYIDLHNDLYKSSGSSASSFKFPYEKSYFDFACAISVFTHMLPEEIDNYIRECSLTLKQDGFLVATFFIMDEESKDYMTKSSTAFKFSFAFENYYLMNEKVKSANVAYERKYLYALINESGFEIVKDIKGYWCGRHSNEKINFQDILVMKKKI
jgi:SAM-dependent methyltransferase